MSSIKFDASLNIEKLYEELKKANQSFEEFSKKGTASGDVIDKSFQKNTVNIKQQLTQQKQYVKELEEAIKQLEKTREGTSGSQRSNINKELGNLRSDLNKETAIMQNLQKQSIEGNQKEAESQGGLIQSLGKWALGLATVAGAMKIGKAIIESTEGTAKQFEFAVAGAEGGLSYFWKTLATGDFSNFFSNMAEAIRLGHDYAETMHEVKEAGWAQSMQESDLLLRNTQNEIKLRNTDLPKAERLKAGEDRITDEEKLSKGRIKIAEAELTAAMEIAEGRAKIGDPVFNANDRQSWDKNKLLNQLKQVEPESREKVAEIVKTEAYAGSAAAMLNPAKRAAAFQEVFDFKRNATAAEKELYNTMIGYGNLKEEMITNVVKAYNKVGEADNSAVAGLKRVFTTVSGVTKQIKDDEAAAAKKAKEDAELDNRIKKTKDLMKDAQGAELDGLAQKLVALEKEKKLRDDLINQAIMLAQDPTMAGKNGVIPAMTMKSGGLVTSKLANKIDSKEAKNDLVDTTKKFIKETEKKGAELSKEEVERLKEQKQQRLEILNAAMELTYEMAKQLGLGEDEMRLLDETMSAITKAASGDYIGAAFSAMMAVSDGLIKLQGDFGAAQRAEGIKKVNDLLIQQNKIVQEAVRFGHEEAKRTEELRLLKEKQLQLTKNQKAEEDAINKKSLGATILSFTGLAGLLAVSKAKQKLQTELAATKAEIEAVNQQIKDAEQALADLKTGGVTENTLSDAIARGFQEGKTSVNDFADYMNQVLLDAVMNIFKGDILADMQPLLEKVRESLSDKKLTKEEKDRITTEAKRVADENQALWKDLTGSLDLGTGAKPAGMSGTIQRSITEETGTELAGLFRRNADDTRGIRDFTKLGVNHLMAIEANTGETVVQLKRAVAELQSIVSNTKVQYTGKIGG